MIISPLEREQGVCQHAFSVCLSHTPNPSQEGKLVNLNKFYSLEQITIASTQVDKRFGAMATEFHTTETLHRAVPLVHRIHVLTQVTIACLAFLLGYLRDVHVIGGLEIRALHATHRFEIVELKIIAQSSPSIVHQR